MKHILINSKNRNSGSSSNFEIRSQEFIEGLYKVKNIIIVNSFFVITTGVNDRFKLNGVDIIIQSGSYNIGTIINAIQSSINASFVPPNRYTININQITGRIFFNSNIVFSLDFSNDLKYILGFVYNSYNGLGRYEAENFSNISKYNLGINIKQATNDYNIYNFSNVGNSYNIYVNLISNFGDILKQNFTDIEQYIFINRTNKLNISVIDINTNLIIDFSNAEIELLLEKT